MRKKDKKKDVETIEQSQTEEESKNDPFDFLDSFSLPDFPELDISLDDLPGLDIDLESLRDKDFEKFLSEPVPGLFDDDLCNDKKTRKKRLKHSK